jgi:hypothetical protein
MAPGLAPKSAPFIRSSPRGRAHAKPAGRERDDPLARYAILDAMRKPTTKVKTRGEKPIVGEFWVRRSDREVVSVERVGRTAATYCVHAELIVWDALLATWATRFRRAEEEDLKRWGLGASTP